LDWALVKLTGSVTIKQSYHLCSTNLEWLVPVVASKLCCHPRKCPLPTHWFHKPNGGKKYQNYMGILWISSFELLQARILGLYILKCSCLIPIDTQNWNVKQEDTKDALTPKILPTWACRLSPSLPLFIWIPVLRHLNSDQLLLIIDICKDKNN
jgi:hypothetical protein